MTKVDEYIFTYLCKSVVFILNFFIEINIFNFKKSGIVEFDPSQELNSNSKPKGLLAGKKN